MKRSVASLIFLSVVASGLSSFIRADESDEATYPHIVAQPTDQEVLLGGTAVMTAQSPDADAYQWLRNGVPIRGQTNSSLTLYEVEIEDVGYYSCALIKASEVAPTRAAALTAYTLTDSGTITVYAWPIANGGSSGSCPGEFAGYVSYTKTVSAGWGWAPSSGTSVHTATDENRSDTKIEYLGKYSDSDCAQTTVAVTDPTPSPKYRFTIYFPNNVPTNSYAITLSGFDP